jgi:hypothetical protein
MDAFIALPAGTLLPNIECSLSLLFEYLKLTLNWQIYQVLCTMSGRATSSQKQLEEYKVIFAAKQALLGAWGRNKRQEKQAD